MIDSYIYMKKRITDNEIKMVLLSILDSVDKYCKENGLSYFLAYGSLIGAIRHNGFIPWDDDIDICMPRCDYDYFIKNYNSEKHDFTTLISIENDEEYYLSSAKVIDTRTILHEYVDTSKEIGVYLDVFPIDNCSSNYQLACKQIIKTAFLQNCLTIKNLSYSNRGVLKNTIVKFLKVILKPISRELLIKKIKKISTMYNNVIDSEYMGLVTDPGYGRKEILNASWLKETMECEFEGKSYRIPVHYDEILTQIYGDYMQLPPPEKQISHHGFEAWWK